MKTNLMNHVLRRALLAAGVCAGLLQSVSYAEEKPAEPKVKPEVARPEAPKKPKPARAMVPFLGVALGPMDDSLAAQLNLPEGAGILVRAVMPDSPAAKAGLQVHDVLHHFNDQLLVNEPQLLTLVRQAGIGTEVTLKLLRKGKEETAVVRLGEHEDMGVMESPFWRGRGSGDHGPGASGWIAPPRDGRMFNVPMNGEGFANRVRELSERMKELEGKPEELRREVDRFRKEMQEQSDKAADAAAKQADIARKMSEIARDRGASSSHASSKVWKDDKGHVRVEINTNDEGPGTAPGGVVTATADDKGNVIVSQSSSAKVAWKDDDGSGELVIENGRKHLTARDRDGREIFSGPVDTEDQLKQLPPKVREQVEKIQNNVNLESRPPGRKLEY